MEEEGKFHFDVEDIVGKVDDESERDTGYQNRILRIEEGEQKKWRRKNVGLGIHVNEGGRKSNEVIKRKKDTISTVGLEVRPGLTISKGDEVFV